MKKYRVIALSVHCDKLNRHFHSQDIVTEDQFHEGQPAELVKQGFLEEYHDRLPADDEQRFIDHVVTQEDIDNNPDGGLVLGETIQIPMGENPPPPAAASKTKGKTTKK